MTVQQHTLFDSPAVSEAAPPDYPLELPRLRPFLPVQTQAGKPHYPPFGVASEPVGSVDNTAARLDPSSAAEPRALPADCVPGGQGAFLAIAEARREQIERWGHTPEKDLATPINLFLSHLLHQLDSYAGAALEDHQARLGLDRVRLRCARVGAIAAAVITRIDAEPTERGKL